MRRLAGTELTVSAVGMGCWTIGGEGWGDVDEETAIDAIRAAVEAGITLFDTAPIYGRGRADKLLRDALGATRREVVIATKVGPRFVGHKPVCDLSPHHLRADVEGSLSRLSLDTLPLVQVHWPCELGTPLDATLETLERMRDEGKLRYYGLCNYGAAEVEEARRIAKVTSIQAPLSLVRRGAEATICAAAIRSGVSVIAYEPLARGLLSGKYQRMPHFPRTDLRHRDRRFWGLGFARLAPRIERLRRAAAAAKTSPAALAIAWTASRSGVDVALAGARTRAQVLENASAAALLSRPDAPRWFEWLGEHI